VLLLLLLQGDNINTIVKAAGITVEPYWPSLFAKLFSKKSVEDLIANVGAGVHCAPYGQQLQATETGQLTHKVVQCSTMHGRLKLPTGLRRCDCIL